MSTIPKLKKYPSNSGHSLLNLATLSVTKFALYRIPASEVYQGVATFIERVLHIPLKDIGIDKIWRLKLRASNGLFFEVCLIPGVEQRILVMMEPDRKPLGIDESNVRSLD